MLKLPLRLGMEAVAEAEATPEAGYGGYGGCS